MTEIVPVRVDVLKTAMQGRKPLGPCARCGAAQVAIHVWFPNVMPLEVVSIICASCGVRTKPRKLSLALTDWRKGRFFEAKE